MAITTVLTNNPDLIFCALKLRIDTERGFPIDRFTYTKNGYSYSAYKNPILGQTGLGTQITLEVQPYPYLGVARTTVGIAATNFVVEAG